MASNFVEGFPEVTGDTWLGMAGDSFAQLAEPWDALSIHQESAQEAYLTVLDDAGCSLPARDAVDRRIIKEVRNGTASHGSNGIIDTPEDVGGWPELSGGTAPVDTDNDGMPDAWELNCMTSSDCDCRSCFLQPCSQVSLLR